MAVSMGTRIFLSVISVWVVVWGIAADDALLGVRFDAFAVDNKESEVCKGFVAGAVVCGADMLFIEIVDFVYSGVDKGPRSFLAEIGFDVLEDCLCPEI